MNIISFFRPKDEDDYYSVGRYLVSKKFAMALAILVIVICICMIGIMAPAWGGDFDYRTYRYNSVALKLVTDKVRILGKSGYTAYVGDVRSGIVEGEGTLYGPSGNIVYQGAFEANKYNGFGTLYYENQKARYEGEFADNVYQGSGKEYREDGSLLYEGQFAAGRREGTGTLFDAGGNRTYEGSFMDGDISYQSFLGKKTSEIAGMYAGEAAVYESGSGYCVYMKDISAVYCSEDGSDTLDEDWSVSGVYVLKQEIMLDGEKHTDIPNIRKVLGEPIYEGNTNLTLQDEIALNLAVDAGEGDCLFGRAELALDEVYADVYEVDEYQTDYLAYLYVFERDGITYQFFCSDVESTFSYYSIE